VGLAPLATTLLMRARSITRQLPVFFCPCCAAHAPRRGGLGTKKVSEEWGIFTSSGAASLNMYCFIKIYLPPAGFLWESWRWLLQEKRVQNPQKFRELLFGCLPRLLPCRFVQTKHFWNERWMQINNIPSTEKTPRGDTFWRGKKKDCIPGPPVLVSQSWKGGLL